MAQELIVALKHRFSQNKFFIFATSWGSVLSAKLASNSPYGINGVIAWGQVIKDLFFCDAVYQQLEQSKCAARKLKKMQRMDISKITHAQMGRVMEWVRKYTEGYQNKNGRLAPVWSIVWGLITSPDYNIRNFLAMGVNGCTKHMTLFRELLALDLSNELLQVKVPYFILQGDTDIVAPTLTVQTLLSHANNPFLEMRVVKNSGHLPSGEMMDAVMEEMLRLTKISKN